MLSLIRPGNASAYAWPRADNGASPPILPSTLY